MTGENLRHDGHVYLVGMTFFSLFLAEAFYLALSSAVVFGSCIFCCDWLNFCLVPGLVGLCIYTPVKVFVGYLFSVCIIIILVMDIINLDYYFVLWLCPATVW